MVMDLLAAECTAELVDEALLKELFEAITGTHQIEENGGIIGIPSFVDNLAIQKVILVPLFLQILPLLEDEAIQHYYSLFTSLFSSTSLIDLFNRYQFAE